MGADLMVAVEEPPRNPVSEPGAVRRTLPGGRDDPASADSDWSRSLRSASTARATNLE